MNFTETIIKIIKAIISFLDQLSQYLLNYNKIINSSISKIVLLFLALGPVFIAFIAQMFLYDSAPFHNNDIPLLKIPIIFKISQFLPPSDLFDIGIILYVIAVISFILIVKKHNKSKDLNYDYLLRKRKSPQSTFNRRFLYLSMFFLCGLAGIILLFVLIYLLLLPYNFSFFVIWLISIVCWICGFIMIDGKLPNLILFRLNKNEIGFLLLAMLIAGLLAIPYNNVISPVESVDLTGIYLTAKDITENFFKINLFENVVWSVPRIGFLFQVIGLKFFGISLSGVRMSSAIAFILIIPVFYLLGRNLFSRRVAAMATIILLYSHVFIQYSRTSMWSLSSVLFHLISVLCFVVALRTGQKVFMFIAGLIAAYSFLGYAGAMAIVPIMIIYFVYLFIRYHKNTFTIAKYCIVFVMAFLIVCCPVVFNSLKHGSYVFVDDGSYHQNLLSEKTQQEIIRSYWESHGISSKIFILGDLTLKTFYNFSVGFDQCGCYETPQPHLDFYLFIFSFFALFLVFFKRRNCFYILCFTFALCVIILGGIVCYQATSKRMVLGLPYLILMASIAMTYTADNLALISSNLSVKKLIKKGFIVFSVVLIILLNLNMYFVYLKEAYSVSTRLLDDIQITNTIKRYHNKYLIYTASELWEGELNLRNNEAPGFILFGADKYAVLLPEEYNTFTISLNVNELPIKEPVSKDVCFIFDKANGYFPMNIILKYYPGGQFIPMKNNNLNNFYYIYIVPKETINAKL